MTPHAKRATAVIVAAFGLDAVLGWVFALVQHIPVIDGLYYAVTTASTVGYGDIYPTHPMSKLVTVIMELTVIPLFASAYSLMTAGLTTANVTARVKRHIDKRHMELKNDPFWPPTGTAASSGNAERESSTGD